MAATQPLASFCAVINIDQAGVQCGAESFRGGQALCRGCNLSYTDGVSVWAGGEMETRGFQFLLGDNRCWIFASSPGSS
ncbi:hypothetical protein [Trichloromonas sp.]|uniref:hypothetical protein n=1 Tax=Trichloromonas sp. TaxID=3069249 RepID=UPI002A4BFC2E|nr:hypothetical protein [Trichloromonas sp.]